MTAPPGDSDAASTLDRVGAAFALVRSDVENGERVTLRLDTGWAGVSEVVTEIARSARHSRVLAINAAIEAAYAEDARGFGHVAERMRGLAQTTLAASAEISAIVARARAAAAETLRITRSAIKTVARATAALKRGALDAATELMAETTRAGEGMRGGIHAMHDATSEAETLLQRVSDISADAELLAINAAVEAARAGTHGLGFTVIADEIGRLSNGTRTATDDVVETIRKLRDRSARFAQASVAGVEHMTAALAAVRERSGGPELPRAPEE